jgi:hypothetical protein
VYNSFNPNTKLYNSSRFKLGKVAKECKVKEESLGDNLNNYLAKEDKYKLNSNNKGSVDLKGLDKKAEVTDFKRFSSNNKEITDFKGFSN